MKRVTIVADEQVMSDALFKLAGELSLQALHQAKQKGTS